MASSRDITGVIGGDWQMERGGDGKEEGKALVGRVGRVGHPG